MPAKSKKAVTAQATPSRPLPAAKPSQTALNSINVAKSNDADTRQARLSTHTASPTPLPLSEQAESASLNTDPDNAPAVNRKKQKRREKEAAKRAAEQNLNNGFPTSGHQVQNGHASFPHQGRGPPKGYFTEENDYIDPDFADEAVEVDDAFYSGPEDPAYSQDPMLQNGYQHTGQASNQTANGKKKKKNGKGGNYSEVAQNHDTSSLTSLTRAPAPLPRSHPAPPPPLSNAALRATHKITDRIWNTSTQAERENIKQFWLELGEDERRSLVKVEKEAVLRKMKEQQKHSCSCTVCGRKRTAIEEELEVLYDAYYEELEQFANHNHGMPNGPPIMAPSRTYNHVRSPPPMAGTYPARGRVQEIGDEEDDLDEDEEYDEEDEPFSDEEVEELPRPPPDFFTFGNSLTVKGT
jgi:Salt tolerance down-regulator